jgi:hypothetical protein
MLSILRFSTSISITANHITISSSDYFLHLANLAPEHKNCPPWPHRDADANNTPMEMTNGALSFQTSTGEAQFLQRGHPRHDGLLNMDLFCSPLSRCAPPRKLKHRVIEKRYRTNLNEKFTLLRDNIPSFVYYRQKDLKPRDKYAGLRG